VTDWNTGQLPLRFYTGLTAAPVKRTTHNWGLKAAAGGGGGGSSSRGGGGGGSTAAAAAAGAAGGGGSRTGMAAFLDDQKQQ
jgi:hypothetical protein